jgi:hypothetical protein
MLSDCLFVDLDALSDSLGIGVSSDVIVALVNCLLTCLGKYILLRSVS